MSLAPTCEARSGPPIRVQWLNDLPEKKLFLPAVDSTIHGSESNVPEVRSVVHLHGAKVLADSDGYPEAWFTNGYGKTGPFFSTRVYHYPNDRSEEHTSELQSRPELVCRLLLEIKKSVSNTL